MDCKRRIHTDIQFENSIKKHAGKKSARIKKENAQWLRKRAEQDKAKKIKKVPVIRNVGKNSEIQIK